jgi:hypothetical protein
LKWFEVYYGAQEKRMKKKEWRCFVLSFSFFRRPKLNHHSSKRTLTMMKLSHVLVFLAGVVMITAIPAALPSLPAKNLSATVRLGDDPSDCGWTSQTLSLKK